MDFRSPFGSYQWWRSHHQETQMRFRFEKKKKRHYQKAHLYFTIVKADNAIGNSQSKVNPCIQKIFQISVQTNWTLNTDLNSLWQKNTGSKTYILCNTKCVIDNSTTGMLQTNVLFIDGCICSSAQMIFFVKLTRKSSSLSY